MPVCTSRAHRGRSQGGFQISRTVLEAQKTGLDHLRDQPPSLYQEVEVVHLLPTRREGMVESSLYLLFRYSTATALAILRTQF